MSLLLPVPLLDPATVHRTVLPNGLTVLLHRDDSAPVVAIVTHVRAGYFDESDDVVGIAHVLEHMYFKGTAHRGVGEISRETKAAGGYLNAGTIYDHTSYYTVLPASGLERGLEIQADAYAGSLIDADELRKELEVIIQEAKRKADNPSAVTVETLYELLHDVHRMRRWRIGREAGLRALTREAVLRFYRTFYQPSATVLCVVGALDLDATMRQIERLYAPLPNRVLERVPGPAEPEREGFRYREMEGDITQSQIAFGWRTQPTMHPDTPLLDLAAAVLGSGRASRLFRGVRERKLAASVAAFNYTPTDLGVFVMTAEGPPERALDAARAEWAELRALRETGPDQAELWRARRLFESRWIRRFETMEGQANYLAEWEALGDWTMGQRYLERLITAEEPQVAEAIRLYLAPERAALVLYRPSGAPSVAPDAEAMREILDAAAAEQRPTPPPRVPMPLPPASRPPRLEREEGRVRVYRTAADVPVLLCRKPAAPLVHIGVYFTGGASQEDAEHAGLTMLLTRTALKGTEHRTAAQIAEDAELLGGSITPAAGPESFGWSISVPAMNADAALELLADVVQRPTLAAAALDTERAIALADLALLRDDMYRYPLRLLTGAAFAGHPYGIPASGTEESLPRIDAALLRDWHAARVLEGAGVIAIVGDAPPDAMAELAARAFGMLHAGAPSVVAPPSWPGAPVQVVTPRDKTQTAIALGFPAPDRTDPERLAAQLIASVASGLGGRFFEELRDRQSLAYTVQAFTSARRQAGIFVCYIATSPEKEETARRGLLAEIEKLRATEVTVAELAQAKQYTIGSHAIRQQSGGAVLGELLDDWMFGTLAEMEGFPERVERVTAGEMKALAERCLDPARAVEAVVRGTGRVV